MSDVARYDGPLKNPPPKSVHPFITWPDSLPITCPTSKPLALCEFALEIGKFEMLTNASKMNTCFGRTPAKLLDPDHIAKNTFRDARRFHLRVITLDPSSSNSADPAQSQPSAYPSGEGRMMLAGA